MLCLRIESPTSIDKLARCIVLRFKQKAKAFVVHYQLGQHVDLLNRVSDFSPVMSAAPVNYTVYTMGEK